MSKMEIIIKHTKSEKQFANNLEKDLKDMKKDYLKVNFTERFDIH